MSIAKSEYKHNVNQMKAKSDDNLNEYVENGDALNDK